MNPKKTLGEWISEGEKELKKAEFHEECLNKAIQEIFSTLPETHMILEVSAKDAPILRERLKELLATPSDAPKT